MFSSPFSQRRGYNLPHPAAPPSGLPLGWRGRLSVSHGNGHGQRLEGVHRHLARMSHDLWTLDGDLWDRLRRSAEGPKTAEEYVKADNVSQLTVAFMVMVKDGYAILP